MWVNIRSRVNKRGQEDEGVKIIVKLLYYLSRYHQGIGFSTVLEEHQGMGFLDVLKEHQCIGFSKCDVGGSIGVSAVLKEHQGIGFSVVLEEHHVGVLLLKNIKHCIGVF